MSRRVRIALLIVLLLAVADLSRPPPEQASARLLLGAIDLYQATLSPVNATLGARCRFRPSCSRYAEAVVRRDGALLGAVEAAVRIGRCGPWTPMGTWDPP